MGSEVGTGSNGSLGTEDNDLKILSQDFKKLHNLQSKTQCLHDNSNNIWDHTCRRHLECPDFIDQDSLCEFGLCKIPYYKQQISYRQYK